MRMTKSVGLIVALALLALMSATVGVLALAKEAAPETVASTIGVQARQEPIIVDHTCTDLDRVPDPWIEQAQDTLDIFYGHTSHGSQLVSGLDALGIPLPPLFDASGDDLGSNGDTSWVAPTQSYLDAHPETNVVLWSWCGGVSDNTEEGINTYLNAMNQLENEYPDVTFVYMTGHLDGGGVDGNLTVRNNQIRDYCRANNKVLFDFADIESYDPDGSEYLSRLALDTCQYDGNGDGDPRNDGANWADEWCADHGGDPLCAACSCAHSEALNCQLKGRATWWMLARIAGWGGIVENKATKTASKDVVKLGDRVAYTIAIQDHAAPPTTTLYLTDDVPSGLTYVPGSLTATAGLVDDASAPELYWSGTLSPTGAVTVTYAVTVSTVKPQQITNWAVIAAPGYETVTRTATITVVTPLTIPDPGPSYKVVSASHADLGERITYTIHISNVHGPLTDTWTMTDTLQPGLVYVSGTLTATLGAVDDTDAPTLTWSGVLSPTPRVTIQYMAEVSTSEPGRVENLALISWPGRSWGNIRLAGITWSRQAALYVNSVTAYLPYSVKNLK